MFENLLFVKYNYHATLRFRNTEMLRWESIISASKTVNVRFLFLLIMFRSIKIHIFIYINIIVEWKPREFWLGNFVLKIPFLSQILTI